MVARDPLGDVEQWFRDPVAGVLVVEDGLELGPSAAWRFEHRAGEKLRVAQGVGDAVRSDGVFVVRGVADQRPAGAAA